MFIHFLCLCPLRLVIMLNSNISKEAYCIGNCRCRELVILKECINFFMTIDQKKNKLFSIVGSWEVAIKRSSPVLHKMIYNVHMHFLRRLRDIQTRNGGLYLEGRFNGGFFALPDWGAYIWRGLYMEGLIFGILRYFNHLCSIGISRVSSICLHIGKSIILSCYIKHCPQDTAYCCISFN